MPTSPFASARGLPCSRVRSWARSSWCSRMRACRRRRMAARSAAVFARQAGKAREAASTARFVSLRPLFGTEPRSTLVAGLVTGMASAPAAIHSPSMRFALFIRSGFLRMVWSSMSRLLRPESRDVGQGASGSVRRFGIALDRLRPLCKWCREDAAAVRLMPINPNTSNLLRFVPQKETRRVQEHPRAGRSRRRRSGRASARPCRRDGERLGRKAAADLCPLDPPGHLYGVHPGEFRYRPAGRMRAQACRARGRGRAAAGAHLDRRPARLGLQRRSTTRGRPAPISSSSARTGRPWRATSSARTPRPSSATPRARCWSCGGDPTRRPKACRFRIRVRPPRRPPMSRQVVATLAVTLFLSLSPGVGAETLRIGMQADPATLDPAQSASFVDRVALAAVCDKLIDLDAKLSFVPQLATEWSWADDGLALTMKLRPGVVFHDGEPLDAEAVRFNLERNKTAAYSRRQSELKPMKGLVVVDPLTVRFELSEPYAPLMAQLADRAGMMVSPKAARELGEKMTNRPVCAGPYKFLEWVPQDRIVFERFERYWNAGAIHIDRVAYLPVPDDTVRLANLRSGGFQLTERIAPTDLATVRGDPRVRLYESPSVAYRVLSVSVGGEAGKTPLGSNPKLREAFELSLDRVVINQVAFDGVFIPSNQPEAPGTPYYAKAFPVPPRDLARAKALVAESGFKRVPATLLISTDPLDNRVAQIIQAMAGEAGFDIKLNVVEAATLLGRLKSGAYEVSLLIWSGRSDPDANISIWVACDGFVNWGRYCNPKLDDILRRARSTIEPDERARLYAEAAAIYLAERPYLFMYHLKWFWGATRKLTEFTSHPDGIARLQGLRLAE